LHNREFRSQQIKEKREYGSHKRTRKAASNIIKMRIFILTNIR
jgi:hypothetical protein